ncbi:MAG: DUF3187 family protein, partial [Deltaproteobacteria bacterium]|nr:DUF3187 family protein [Deltaproteobacteria bacterium]
ILCIFLTLPAHAKIFTVTEPKVLGPMTTRSQSPLYLQFVSDHLETPATLPMHRISSSIDFSLSNMFERRRRLTGTGIDLDMELYRTGLSFHYGVLNNYEIGLELPFLSFSAGFLDSFIQGYHNAFGVPNAGRQRVDNNRFSYLITQNGATIYQVSQADFGMGDLIFYQKAKLMDEKKMLPELAAKALIKLPTGSPTAGTGSGAADFSFSLLGEKSWKRWHSTTQLGFDILGKHKILSALQRTSAFHFGQAIEFNLRNHLSLVAQITGNTSFFKNVTIPELSQPILDLTIGVSGEILPKKTFRKIKYEVAFTEDPLTTGPSVDFAILLKAGIEY